VLGDAMPKHCPFTIQGVQEERPETESHLISLVLFNSNWLFAQRQSDMLWKPQT
jgi:hypothetical protein